MVFCPGVQPQPVNLPVSKAAKVRMVSSTLRPTAVSLIVECLRFPSGSMTKVPRKAIPFSSIRTP